MPFEQFDRFWDRAITEGAMPAGLDAWEIARVEAGRPEWGIDIDDTTWAQIVATAKSVGLREELIGLQP